jgi:hypothetical protein
MPRAKAPVKRRPHSKRHAKRNAPAKRSAAPAMPARREAPAFPSDIMIAAPSGTRNRIVKTPFLPVPAVRDAGSERLLVRNAQASPRRADRLSAASPPPKGADTADNMAARDSAPALVPQPDMPPSPSEQPVVAATPRWAVDLQPREGRIAATGRQPSASAVQVPTYPPSQAIPPASPRPETPVAALFSEPPRRAASASEAKPLPRSAAITAYRKNGPIDVLAYWLRTSQKSLVALFARKKTPPLSKQAIIEINRLRLENLLLQRQIELLRSQLHVAQ